MTSNRPEVALVTGAGSPDGIGFAVARRLVMRGCAVLITSTTQRIDQRVDELQVDSARVIRVVADLTDRAAADHLVERAVTEFGGLDILVNNAGIASVGEPDNPHSIIDIDDDAWRQSLARNLDTAMFVSRAALRPMQAARYGRIVNVASVSGPVLAYRGDVGYHAAKAALVGLTRSAAIDTAALGITVNAVAPGWIATGSSTDHELQMGAATPLGRPGTADEVAGLIEYLTSRTASYLTGQVIVVDGGNSIMEERGL